MRLILDEMSWKWCWKHYLSRRAKDPYPLLIWGWRVGRKLKQGPENFTPNYVYVLVISTSSPLNRKWRSEVFFTPFKIITLVLPRLIFNCQRLQNKAKASNCLYNPSRDEERRTTSSAKSRIDIRTWWRMQPSVLWICSCRNASNSSI